MSFVHYSRFKTIYTLVLRIKFWQCQLYLKIKKSRSGHVTKQKEAKRQNCLDPKLSFCPTHFISTYLYAMHNDIEMCSSLIFLIFSWILGVFQLIIVYSSCLASCVVRHLWVPSFLHNTLWHESWLHI